MGSDEKQRDIIQELNRAGWTLLRHGGGHDIYACPCGKHTVPVPRHRMVSAGVCSSIRKAIANCT